MSQLRELQADFARSLRDPAAALPAVRSKGLTAAQRLQVYRNNSRSALAGALRAGFPATEKLVGQDFFAAAAQACAEEQPSRSGNIQDYGAVFPDFLKSYSPAASLPYLADVVRLEWLRVEAAAAEPGKPMDLVALAAVPENRQPQLHFRLAPTVRILDSPYPVLRIWEFCQSQEPAARLDIDGAGERVLIARPELDVYLRRLSPGECGLLQAFAAGSNFEPACSLALQAEPDFNVASAFAGLVQDQVLTEFYF